MFECENCNLEHSNIREFNGIVLCDSCLEKAQKDADENIIYFSDLEIGQTVIIDNYDLTNYDSSTKFTDSHMLKVRNFLSASVNEGWELEIEFIGGAFVGFKDIEVLLDKEIFVEFELIT